MKKLWIAFAAAACLLAACTEDEAENPGLDRIAISTEAIPAGPDGTTTELTVTSSGDWRVAGVCEWARVSAVAGKDGDKVTVTVDPNDTDEGRQATFKFFTGSAVAPLTVTSEPGYMLELVSDSQVTLESDETALRVKLHTNIEELTCSFSGEGGKWIAFEGRSEGFGNTVLSFAVTPNPGYGDRSTELTVSGLGLSFPVKIIQRQIDDIQVDETARMLDLTEQTIAVDVKTNVAYEVAIEGEWITHIGTRAPGSERLEFHLDAAAASRAGKITLKGAGITRHIVVVQKDPDAQVAVIPDETLRSILVEWGWIVDLGEVGGIVTGTGLAATEFTYNPGWWDPQIESLEGIGNFPELTSIDLTGNQLTEIDLSQLTKVATLKCEEMALLKTVKLGSNPIQEFNGWKGVYLDIETCTISGDRLTSIDLSLDGWQVDYDQLSTVDVSGCPALETLNCDRGSATLTKLILKQGQTIPNLTKRETTLVEYK